MTADLTAHAAARKACRDNMPVDFMGDKRMESWTDLMAHYAVAAAAPLTEAQARERIAADIEARRIVCPVHHMPDCSPLLNGCSLPIHLHEQRAIDARIARGTS